MDWKHEVIVNKQRKKAPLSSVKKTAAAARHEEFHADIDEVAAKLEQQGFDPLEYLMEAVADQGNALNSHQRISIARWLMEYRYPKKKAMEVSGVGGGAIQLTWQT